LAFHTEAGLGHARGRRQGEWAGHAAGNSAAAAIAKRAATS
jgi:hypothetical protein